MVGQRGSQGPGASMASTLLTSPAQLHRCCDPAAEYANFRGVDNVTHEDIVREVKPQGRAKVPDSLKAELLRKIRDVLES